jgi:hypothetical protein
LGPVDGIAESEAIVRPGNLQGNAAHHLKSKVRMKNASFLSGLNAIVHGASA